MRNYRSDIDRLELLHKEFAQPLNVVILVKTHQTTGSQSHIILFSRDLQLSYEQLIDYYSLRFQIEFNFRDAKQFWGLEDFLNTNQTAVTSAANLSFFLVNLSHYLLKAGLPFHQAQSIREHPIESKNIFFYLIPRTSNISYLPLKEVLLPPA